MADISAWKGRRMTASENCPVSAPANASSHEAQRRLPRKEVLAWAPARMLSPFCFGSEAYGRDVQLHDLDVSVLKPLPIDPLDVWFVHRGVCMCNFPALVESAKVGHTQPNPSHLIS